jgi:pimeloyl-ACP methyl ester carboxylesterase
MTDWVASQRFRTSSGAEMAYVDAGAGDDLVVLLHGFPTTSLLWREVGPALVGSFRVIAPDLLGYGSSDQPADAPLDPRAQAGHVGDLVDALRPARLAVVGHDIGGIVAQLLALDRRTPDAVALLDTDAFDLWPIEGLRMLQDAEPDQEEPGFVGAVVDLTFDLGTTRKEALTTSDLTAFREQFVRDDDAAHAFFRAARAIDGIGLAGRDDDLAALDVPALLVWGEDDPYVGVEIGDRLVETLARPALVTLPDVGHFTPLEAADVVAPLLEQFLATHLLGRGHEHGPEHAHGVQQGPVPVTLEVGRRGQA